MRKEAADPTTAVVLFDVVLGYGAHADPAAGSPGASWRAQAAARSAGPQVAFIGYVCGTDSRPAGPRPAGGGARAAPACWSPRAMPRPPPGPPAIIAPRGTGEGPVMNERCSQQDARRSSTSACRRSPTTIARPAAARSQLAWAPPGQGDAGARRWTLAGPDRRPADRGGQPRSPSARYLAAQPRLRRPRGPRATPSRASARRAADPARRSADRLGRACAARMQGAIVGAILYEGWADDARSGAKARGRRRASLSSPAMTTAPSGRWPASSARPCRCGSSRTPTAGNRAFCNLNEGLGKVLRFGANADEVLDRLRWMAASSSPTLQAARRAGWPNSSSSR